MHKHIILYVILFIMISLFGFTSCTIKQDIYINADSTGQVSFDIQVEKFFTAVAEDFTTLLPKEDSDITNINIQDMQASINQSPYAFNASFDEPEEDHYTGTFQFGDAHTFFNDVHDELHLESLFSYTTTGNSHTLKLYLDIRNYAELTELIPLLKDPSFAIFGPEENIGVSKADYLDMISYLLGEEGPDAINRSYISLIINTDSPIISQKHGIKHSSKQVEFRIPLIDFLLLADPIDYSITW